MGATAAGCATAVATSMAGGIVTVALEFDNTGMANGEGER